MYVVFTGSVAVTVDKKADAKDGKDEETEHLTGSDSKCPSANMLLCVV